MRQRQFTINCRNVCRCAVHRLVHSLNWAAGTAAVTPERLIQLLVRAAAERRSLSAVVLESAAVPCWETVRRSLWAYLPAEPADLLPALVAALQRRLPKKLSRRPRDMAADLHLRPYYGAKTTKGICRGQPKAGSKTFFAYATLMVLRRGQAFAVGLTPVAQGEEQTATLGRLLDQAERAGLRPRRLLLDRGFYAATTIAWLQARGQAFLMPMIRRGRSGKAKKDCTGTAVFFVKGRRGWAQHTWTARPRRGGRKQAAVAVTVDVCMAPRPRGRGGKRPKGRKGPLVFACHGVTAPPEQVVAWYRRRFGIETSYRQLGQALAATCSTRRSYRLLLVGIALVLRNLWVWLHWAYLSERTAQGRVLRLDRLRLRRLTSWLARALDQTLRPRTAAATPCPQLANGSGGR